MTSDAQTNANRANAQLSCGPTSEEGKAKCSRNALRHGLTARGLIVLPGQEDAFTHLEDQFRFALRPAGELEESIFKVILESAWNLERCRQAQAKLYSQAEDAGVDPLLDDAIEAKYGKIQKYAREYQSSLFKAMHELGRLKTEMQYRHEIHPLTDEEANNLALFEETPQSISAVCDLRKATKPRKPEPSPSETLFQNRANYINQRIMSIVDNYQLPGKTVKQPTKTGGNGFELDSKAA